MKKPYISIVLIALLFVIACLIVDYFESRKSEEMRDTLVWRARLELDNLKNDNTMEFLDLIDYKWEGNTMSLNYYSRLSAEDQRKLTDPQSVIDDFYSVLVVDENRWDTIFYYLEQANVDLLITYSAGSFLAASRLRSDTLSSLMSDVDRIDHGIDLFSKRKSEEVLQYAKNHFYKDRYLNPETVELDKDFVSLKLSFDDSEYDIGYSLRDTSHVADHYTDIVGEMGSLLDGLLSICICSHRGFAIEYNGKNKKKNYRCEWPYQKALELFRKTKHRLYIEKPETNRVRTILSRK